MSRNENRANNNANSKLSAVKRIKNSVVSDRAVGTTYRLCSVMTAASPSRRWSHGPKGVTTLSSLREHTETAECNTPSFCAKQSSPVL